MDEKNKLNDIILTSDSMGSNSKKVILAVATLGVILIIVVILMNSLTSNDQNLPQATQTQTTTLPTAPKANEELAEEPLFEDVKVEKEQPASNEDLDRIAQKLKEETKEVETIEPLPQQHIVRSKPIIKQPKEVHKVKPEPKPVVKKVQSHTKQHFVQVGSFSHYKPNKKFLKSITDSGFHYTFRAVVVNGKKVNKVLVGPFKTRKDAKDALKTIRRNVIKGAFLVEI